MVGRVKRLQRFVETAGIDDFPIDSYLLPGEDPAELKKLGDLVFKTLAPRDVLEKLWAEDVICIAWDLRRYRRLKTALLKFKTAEQLRGILEQAIEAELAEDSDDEDAEQEALDPSNAEQQSSDLTRERAEERSYELASDWKLGRPKDVKEVDRLLRSSNLSLDEALVPAFAEGIDTFRLIDELITTLECRRNNAIRELRRHRYELATIVRTIEADETDDAEDEDQEPKRMPGIQLNN
jgi:hypothetical protein